MKRFFFNNPRAFIILVVALSMGVTILCSCSTGKGNSDPVSQSESAANNADFPYVEIPLYVNNPLDALCFNIERFWAPYLMKAAKDTSLYSMDEKKFEEAYAKYIGLLQILEREKPSFNPEDSRKAARVIANSHKKIFAAADSLYAVGYKKPLMRLIEMSERYLYNPNSPFLNEELYIPAVEAVLELKSLDSLHKMQHVYQKKMVMLNRKGTRAANFDFEYLIPDNKTSHSEGHKENIRRGYSSLYKTEAQYLLIYFNNPGCASCKEIQEVLTNDPAVGNMLVDGKLKVLSMFIDKDTEAWEERFANSPKSWIYARDYRNQFEANELYGIRAIPSIYLLDKNKNVILKDAPVERIIEYFNNNR